MCGQSYRRIPLRARGGAVRAYAVVDEADYEWLTHWPWCIVTGGYAGRTINYPGRRTQGIRMHRQIMGLRVGDGLTVDHINRDRLDNRRKNLRVVPSIVNRQNTGPQGGSSRFRGVYWDARKRRWNARIMLNGRKHRLGTFRAELDAGLAVEAFRAEHMPWVAPDVALPTVPHGHASPV